MAVLAFFFTQIARMAQIFIPLMFTLQKSDIFVKEPVVNAAWVLAVIPNGQDGHLVSLRGVEHRDLTDRQRIRDR